MAKKKTAKKKAAKKAANRSKVPQAKKAKITRHLTFGQVDDIKAKLTSLRNSCLEAIDGVWDRSDDGFEDMETLILNVASTLKIELGDYRGPEPDAEDTSQFSGKIQVLMHDVTFRFWGIPVEIDDELKAELTKEAEDRAKTMIADDYREGELNYFISEASTEIRGWWGIGVPEDDLSTPFHCADCGHKDTEEEFVPSDGNPAPHVCPECGKTNCFAD